jgi:hypothetical protein
VAGHQAATFQVARIALRKRTASTLAAWWHLGDTLLLDFTRDHTGVSFLALLLKLHACINEGMTEVNPNHPVELLRQFKAGATNSTADV